MIETEVDEGGGGEATLTKILNASNAEGDTKNRNNKLSDVAFDEVLKDSPFIKPMRMTFKRVSKAHM